MTCECGPYYDCAEHDTDPMRSRDGWKRRAYAAESELADARRKYESLALAFENAESELRDLRGRVKRAEERLIWKALEALRGR